MKTQNLQQKNGMLLTVNQRCLFTRKWNQIFNKFIRIKSLWLFWCIYFIGNISVTGGDANTKVAFKNCSPFKKCRTEINETFVDNAEHVNIAMPMYNSTEYSDNYSDISGSLGQFKKDEQPTNNNGVFINITAETSSSFKYKSNLIGDTVADGANRKKEGVKRIVPLKYLSNFRRSLEIPLINCKAKLSLEWYENCISSSAGTAVIFTVTDTKLYVPFVTLKTEGNVKLSKLLSKGFKRPIYWNEYKVISNKNYDKYEYIIEQLDASIQRVNRLFVFPYMRGANFATGNSYDKYFSPRLKVDNYNIKIDGRNFYDQPINDLIKQYDEIRKISIAQGDDYTTGCLLDFAYFIKKYRLIAVDLSKQKALDTDSRAIQQIIFTCKASANVLIYYILEKSKETMLEYAKGTI